MDVQKHITLNNLQNPRRFHYYQSEQHRKKHSLQLRNWVERVAGSVQECSMDVHIHSGNDSLHQANLTQLFSELDQTLHPAKSHQGNNSKNCLYAQIKCQLHNFDAIFATLYWRNDQGKRDIFVWFQVELLLEVLFRQQFRKNESPWITALVGWIISRIMATNG